MTVPEIRTATFDDAEALQRYAAKLLSEDLPGLYRRPIPTIEDEIGFLHLHLDRPNCTLLIAVEEGEVLGVIGFVGNSLPQEAHAGVFGLSVDQDHRGRGIGSALVRALVDWAPAHGISRIEVRAFATNPRALELYRRLGFVDEGIARAAVVTDGRPIDVHVLAMLL